MRKSASYARHGIEHAVWRALSDACVDRMQPASMQSGASFPEACVDRMRPVSSESRHSVRVCARVTSGELVDPSDCIGSVAQELRSLGSFPVISFGANAERSQRCACRGSSRPSRPKKPRPAPPAIALHFYQLGRPWREAGRPASLQHCSARESSGRSLHLVLALHRESTAGAAST